MVTLTLHCAVLVQKWVTDCSYTVPPGYLIRFDGVRQTTENCVHTVVYGKLLVHLATASAVHCHQGKLRLAILP